jgi:hypothetical protein
LKPPPQQKKPFTSGMLGDIQSRTDGATLVGARNMAMLVVARAGAFRGESELLAAQLPLRLVARGAEVDVHTKTDKNVHATTARRIPAVGPPGLIPLVVLQHYLRLSGHTTGFVFRNVSGGGTHARSNARGVSRNTLAALVKHWAGVLGFDAREFSTHSLKHGCAADVKNAGATPALGMRVMGHESTSAYNTYGGVEARRRSVEAQRRQQREVDMAVAARAADLDDEVWYAGQVHSFHRLFSVAQTRTMPNNVCI